MSGHSKWSNIKHKKAKQDAKRGKIFTKIGKEIVVAVKEGGPDPSLNNKLRDVIAKAKINNMPNDTIERSIKKASGDKDNVNYENIIYEGYGPKGVAVIVEALTDNKNRTAANVRHAFVKGEGNLGTTGCVSYMFNKKGQILIEKSDEVNEEDLMLKVLELGAEDFITSEDGYEIITSIEDFSNLRIALEEENISFVQAEIAMIPENYLEIDDETKEQLDIIINMLEEDDDIQNIWTNCEG